MNNQLKGLEVGGTAVQSGESEITKQILELSNCSKLLLSQLETLSKRISAIVKPDLECEGEDRLKQNSATELGSYLYSETEKIKTANRILQSLLLRIEL